VSAIEIGSQEILNKECIVTKVIRFGVAALILASSVGVRAQSDQGVGPRPGQVPVKVQLVLSRYQGEKKLSSVPYVLTVTANSREPTRLRMGVQMPIASSDGKGINYRDVGTNIDCLVTTANDNFFMTNLTVNDSSLYFADEKARQAGIPSPGALPTFRTFTSSFNILLRDGQTSQYTSATDQVSGEVMRIDVTLNVQK
jgi:hypothetical protein